VPGNVVVECSTENISGAMMQLPSVLTHYPSWFDHFD
jgi:hypothetical protein